MSSGYAPPPAPDPNDEIIRLLRFVTSLLQVLCALLMILLLVLVGWLLGIFPDFVSPIVEVRVGG